MKLLKQPTTSSFDLYKAIFLNIIPQEKNKDIHFLKLSLVALYRDTIWKARNQATHKNCKISDTTLSTIFISKTNYLLKRFRENETLKSYFG